MKSSLMNATWKFLPLLCGLFAVGLVGCEDDNTASTEADLIAFSIKDVDREFTIDKGAYSITNQKALPFGFDATQLVATYTVSKEATVTVGGTEQVSGETVNNFSSPVVYTITAEDGKTKVDFKITLNIVGASTETAFITFNVEAVDREFTIDIAGGSITNEKALLPGLDATQLVATYTVSKEATVTVGETEQVSGKTVNNFSSPVVYTVTAEDGKTSTNFTVTLNLSDAWTKVTTDAFINLNKPSAFAYDNKLWLVGAINVGVVAFPANAGEYYEYVYSSADGVTWSIVHQNTVGASDSVPLGTQAGTVEYKGNLVNVGGVSPPSPGGFGLSYTFLGVSKSTDGGATWTAVVDQEGKVTPKGANPQLLKSGSNLFVVGAQSSLSFGSVQSVKSMDVYKSTDGLAWDTVATDVLEGALTTTANPTFYATAYFGDAMYIAGGVSGANFITSTLKSYSKSVYKSTDDGATWSVATADGFPQSAGLQIVEYKNKLYAIAGARGTEDNSGTVYTRDIYVSEDAVTWTSVTGALALPDEFAGRAFHNAVVMNDKIYIIGGENADGGINDVWVGEFVN